MKEIFWNSITDNSRSLIRKTAGIQALFRVLKELIPQQLEKQDLSVEVWRQKLALAGHKLNFEISIFTESSGKGKARIQDAILVAIGQKDVEDVKDEVLKAHLKEKLGGADNA